VGCSGAGKSAVGQILERETGLGRFDIDEMISAKFNMSIPDIFSKHGEEKFREAETDTLRSLLGKPAAIIVTGGGIVTKAENIDLLKQLGTVVWLDADHATLRARLNRLNDRPLLQTASPSQSLAELLQARNPVYRKAGDIRVDTAKREPEEVATLILRSTRDFPLGE
jgi:shikimate kinase